MTRWSPTQIRISPAPPFNWMKPVGVGPGQVSRLLPKTPRSALAQLAQRRRRRGRIADRVGHGRVSDAEFSPPVPVGDPWLLLGARFCRRPGIGHVLEGRHRTVVELGRDHDGTSSRAPRGDLDWLALGSCDVVALLVAELGKRHGDHIESVHLVRLRRC